MKLRRFWFEFKITDEASWPVALLLAGCGVTGFDQGDCMRLIQQRIMGGEIPPQIYKIVEDVDISTLDPNHVLPNMGDVTKRGIWFPLGFDPPPRVPSPHAG